MKQLAKIIVSSCKFNEQGQTQNVHGEVSEIANSTL